MWRFAYSRESIEQAFNRERPILRSLFKQFGYNIDNSKLFGSIQHALTLSPTAIKLLAGGLALYAVIELIEAAPVAVPALGRVLRDGGHLARAALRDLRPG